jgi:hypothetical protein
MYFGSEASEDSTATIFRARNFILNFQRVRSMILIL